jgi:hypothetical protein
MTNKPSVPSAVSQRFVSRDLPIPQPLATDPSAVTIRFVSRNTYRSLSRQPRLTNRHRLIFRLNTPFQAELIGCLSACSTARSTASSRSAFGGLDRLVMYV